MIRRVFVLAAGLASLGFNVVRDVDGDGPVVFTNPTVTMELQEDGSADVSDGSDLEALRSAMEVWNQVSCSAFRFVDGGTGSSRSVGADGTNRITFLESNWPGYASGAGAFALRERSSGTPDRWTEFDVLINGQDFEWATDGNVLRSDIMAVAVHELGHGLGLQHTSHPHASMFFAGGRAGTTYGRTLHPDDIAGVCFLYPAQAFSCGSDDDCPLVHGLYGGGNYRSRCNAGTCVEGAAAPYGSACFEANDCETGLCLIDPLNPPSTEPGFCSEPCPSGTCPNGDYCAPTPEGPRCILGRVDCITDADCGENSTVCARQLDGRFQCQKLCLRNSVCMFIAGAVCHGGTGANPPGFCRVPGAGQPGDACENGLECASLNCSAGDVQPTCRDGVPGFEGPPPGDAGVPDAVSPPTDAEVVDVGRPDAAPPADAGRRDVGSPPVGDSGSTPIGADANVVNGLDAGSDPVDLVGSGCRCVSPASASPALVWCLLLGLAISIPRRAQRGRT